MIFFTQKRWKTRQLIVFLLMFSFYHPALGQSRPVSGKIVDASSGEPIVGASVLLVGTNVGVAADVNGLFKINVADGASLEFKSIGYTALTQKAIFDKPMLIKLTV